MVSKQLAAYVEHMGTRAAIRKQIDDAKLSGDIDSEWQGREKMKGYWGKIPAMHSGLLKEYGGDERRMMNDVHAYRLLTEGKSF